MQVDNEFWCCSACSNWNALGAAACAVCREGRRVASQGRGGGQAGKRDAANTPGAVHRKPPAKDGEADAKKPGATSPHTPSRPPPAHFARASRGAPTVYGSPLTPDSRPTHPFTNNSFAWSGREPTAYLYPKAATRNPYGAAQPAGFDRYSELPRDDADRLSHFPGWAGVQDDSTPHPSQYLLHAHQFNSQLPFNHAAPPPLLRPSSVPPPGGGVPSGVRAFSFKGTPYPDALEEPPPPTLKGSTANPCCCCGYESVMECNLCAKVGMQTFFCGASHRAFWKQHIRQYHSGVFQTPPKPDYRPDSGGSYQKPYF